MRVSILMPVLNGAEFLADSVPSVLAQTYGDWELLIGMNNLPDSAPEYDRIRGMEAPGIRVFDLGKTSGVDEARNRLRELASGDLICPLDVDDLWHPEKLARQVPLMSEWDVVGTWCTYFGDRNDRPGLIAGEIPRELLLEVNPLINSSVMLWRRDALWEPRTDGIGDYALWLRLASLGRRMYNLALNLTKYRVHAQSAYKTHAWDVDGLRKQWEPRLRATTYAPRLAAELENPAAPGLITAIPSEDRSRNSVPTDLREAMSRPLPFEWELRSLFPAEGAWTIFDVGARQAADSLRYSRLFPNATIYAFERDPDNVCRAHRHVAESQTSGICIMPVALGSQLGWTRLGVSWAGSSRPGRPAGDPERVACETVIVPTETIAHYCAARGIRTIDLLHLKAPRSALAALEGAKDQLERVRAIRTEAAEHPVSAGPPAVEPLDRLLRERGFAWVSEWRDSTQTTTTERLYVRRTVKRLLIGALSAQAYHDRRERCRGTWMADLRRHPGLDAVFLLGSQVEAPQRNGDELHLPCPDAYATLPQRTREFCKWALDHADFDYLFKCDDDTYIAVDRLAAVDLEGRDYVGRDLGGWASGGAGYFLSRRAAGIVAEELTAETGYEDRCVADVLRPHGITVVDDPRLLPWPPSGELPSAANRTMTAHAIDGDTIRSVHEAVHGSVGFRIAMPTSNHHARVVPVTLELLDRYWPDHPPVDIIHHEVPVASAKAHRQFMAGPQDATPWCDALARYLEHVNREDMLMILLDDYALCGEVKTEQVQRARTIVEADPRVTAFYLTWMQLPSTAPYESAPGVLVCPHWDYTVHLQAGVWRRSSLLRLLTQLSGANCDAFELAGSEIQNQLSTPELHLIYDQPAPAHPSLFLDSVEKTHWAVPYHNLLRRGRPDPRHDAFLRREGFAPLG